MCPYVSQNEGEVCQITFVIAFARPLFFYDSFFFDTGNCHVLTVGVLLSVQAQDFSWDSLLILYVQSSVCWGVPEAGEGVEPSLHCNDNAISPGSNGTFDVGM